jgi:hypothetical protein
MLCGLIKALPEKRCRGEIWVPAATKHFNTSVTEIIGWPAGKDNYFCRLLRFYGLALKP